MQFNSLRNLEVFYIFELKTVVLRRTNISGSYKVPQKKSKILKLKKIKNMQEINAINIMEKFPLFEKQWTPHIIGELNGQYVKLCKLKNDFVWHSHEHEDELFMVFKGTLLMDFRDGRTVEVKEGEILIVPKGVEHRPHTNGEMVFNLLFEPKATLHTGTVESEMTVKELDWI
jgi:mannose-6-phosphate isomerase-like protein (cupin superfamily)